MTAPIDFDFAKYVAHRKGIVHQRARDGSTYSFVGDRKVRRALHTVRPVSLAIEIASRMWKTSARKELLASADRVTEETFPSVRAAAREASDALHLENPSIYILPESSSILAQTVGTNADAYILLNKKVVESATHIELLAIVGNELGHIQNNHVVYMTALFYLEQAAQVFVRWIVKPATIALQTWSRRAEVTCDRAALLCARDVEETKTALTKLALLREGKDPNEAQQYLAALAKGPVKKHSLDIFQSTPALSKRLIALDLFSQSSFYRQSVLGMEQNDGLPAEEVDNQVSELMSLF